jgi:hypothetical protein
LIQEKKCGKWIHNFARERIGGMGKKCAYCVLRTLKLIDYQSVILLRCENGEKKKPAKYVENVKERMGNTLLQLCGNNGRE